VRAFLILKYSEGGTDPLTVNIFLTKSWLFLLSLELLLEVKFKDSWTIDQKIH